MNDAGGPSLRIEVSQAAEAPSPREALLVAGAVNVGLGVALILAAGWLEHRSGWPPAGSWLRFGKLWGAVGLVAALVGGACLLAGVFGRRGGA